MEKTYKYTVAGHCFHVVLAENMAREEYLSSYEPFYTPDSDVEPLFTLRLSLVDEFEVLKGAEQVDRFNDEPPYFWLYQNEGRFFAGFSLSKKGPECLVCYSDDKKDAVVYVHKSASEHKVEFALTNGLMLLYTFTTSPFDTMLIHASVVNCKGGAYMFLGRSGTGKSTHSSLWLKHIEGTSLLNDDNPVVRVIDGDVYVYGSPWSGKTPCYKNEVYPLKAVVRLSQAPYNKITRQSPLLSYASFMPSCSCMKWDKTSTANLHKSVEAVVKSVPMWKLSCLPDKEAAELCSSTVAK